MVVIWEGFVEMSFGQYFKEAITVLKRGQENYLCKKAGRHSGQSMAFGIKTNMGSNPGFLIS